MRRRSRHCKAGSSSAAYVSHDLVRTDKKVIDSFQIRKMWSRELAKCDTPKEKIQHLKKMLSDAGMAAPYSLAKATKIKARRELEDEVAGVQADVSDWNNTNDGMVTTRSGRTSVSSPNTGRRLVSYSPDCRVTYM